MLLCVSHLYCSCRTDAVKAPGQQGLNHTPGCACVWVCVCVLKSEQAYMLTCLREYEFRLYLSCECGVLCMGMGISVYVCPVLSVIDKTQWGVAEIQESH